MNRWRLMLRTMAYFRRVNLAAVAGVAVAAAVLSGALLVGDSVRGSLRDLAERRLGSVDHALTSPLLFPEDLARRLQSADGFDRSFDRCGAGIILRGAVRSAAGGHSTPVQIGALQHPWLHVNAGQAILGPTVAEALGERPAAGTLRFSLPQPDTTPRDAVLAHRDRASALTGLFANRADVAEPAGFAALFDLYPSQRAPRNAWVNLLDLQQALDTPGQANLLLVSARPGAGTHQAARHLNQLLRGVLTLADLGLELAPATDNHVALRSDGIYLARAIESAAEAAASQLDIDLRRVSVHLANRIHHADSPGNATHYAIVAGICSIPDHPLSPGEAAVNQWTARQMNLNIGDQIRFSYYVRQVDGSLAEHLTEPLSIAHILPMHGLGADPTLTPEYPGLTDADSIGEWRPPAGVAIDTRRVTDDDEAYWEAHRAAPKVFVDLATAQRLWGGATPALTSLRLPHQHADQFQAALIDHLDLAAAGMSFQPVRAVQLAAGASTDFAALFVGFSFFLMAGAMLLVAMLTRLSVEQRMRQFGLLAAIGFTPGRQRALALGEALLLCTIGATLGVAGGIAYAWLMLAGLRTWWFDAIGATHLHLHVTPLSLGLGWIIALGVSALVAAHALRQIGRAPAMALLTGRHHEHAPAAAHPGRRPAAAAMILAAIGVAMLLAAVAEIIPTAPGAMAGGASLMACGIIATATLLSPRRTSSASLSLFRLALRNAGRRRSRSILTVALVCLAIFTLVIVSAMRKDPSADPSLMHSGAGGFALMLHADIPLPGSIATRQGRELLGVRDMDNPLWTRASFVPLRVWAGQDVSCLNLTRPDSPTIFAIPEDVLRDRFTFVRAAAPGKWALLNQATPDAIPVIADDETARYILKVNLNQTITTIHGAAGARSLRLAATLDDSIFQGALLMGEGAFLELFPHHSGHGLVLIEAVPEDIEPLSLLLRSELDEYAIIVEATPQVLARYHAVANTHLSTFAALGGLGFALATLGLSVVLLRNLLERRRELALLAALGFPRRRRFAIVVGENALLLALGIAIGAAAALAALLPVGRPVNLPWLAGILAAVLACGLAALLIAALAGMRHTAAAELHAE